MSSEQQKQPQEQPKKGDDWEENVLVSYAREAGESCNENKKPSNITEVQTWYKGRDLRNCSVEGLKQMGAVLRESRVLRKLELRPLSKEGVEALFADETYWPLMEELDLGGNFGLAGARSIISILDPVSKLKTLNLSKTNLSMNAARMLAGALDNTQIDNLLISYNRNIKDKGLEAILSSKNARYLIKLDIKGIDLGDPAYEALSRFLSRGDVHLKTLLVDLYNHRGTGFNRRGTGSDDSDRVNSLRRSKLLVQSIPTSSKLELITIEYESVVEELMSLLCNTSSLEAVKNSNHQLFAFSELSYRGFCFSGRDAHKQQLEKLTKINEHVSEGGSIFNAIRRKLRNFYFTKQDFDVQHLNEMDVALMPYVLHLIMFDESIGWGRYPVAQGGSNNSHNRPQFQERNSIDGLFHFFKNCHPSQLFSFPSPESLLCQKDEKILKLENVVADMKADNKRMADKVKLLEQENEKLRKSRPSYPNKRAKTDDGARMDNMEHRLAALEADVAKIKGSQTIAVLQDGAKSARLQRSRPVTRQARRNKK